MAYIDLEVGRLKDGSAVSIRTGVEDDAPSLLATISTYISENEGMVWEPDEYRKTEVEMREWIGGMLRNPAEILILAELQGRIVGNLDFHAGGRKRTAHVGEIGMGMLPELRGKGLGSLLIKQMIAWAQDVPQLEKINLRVISTNQRALNLYTKFGFEEEGRRTQEFKYRDGSYADEVLMRRFTASRKG
jgi:RimJ/RimL family protein N-acetyltransferase